MNKYIHILLIIIFLFLIILIFKGKIIKENFETNFIQNFQDNYNKILDKSFESQDVFDNPYGPEVLSTVDVGPKYQFNNRWNEKYVGGQPIKINNYPEVVNFPWLTFGNEIPINNKLILSIYNRNYYGDLQNQVHFMELSDIDIMRIIKKINDESIEKELDKFAKFDDFYSIKKNRIGYENLLKKITYNPNISLYQQKEEVPNEILKEDEKLIKLWNENFVEILEKYYPRRDTILMGKYIGFNYFILESKRDSKFIENEYFVILVRENSIFGIQLYVITRRNLENNEINLKIFYIGVVSLDEIFLKGKSEKIDNKYYLDIGANPILIDNQAVIPYKQKKMFDIKNNYACFTYNSNKPEEGQSIQFAVNKADCESKYSFLGDSKPFGVWDKPCKKDEECIFYKGNRNYENDYGKCVNNTCQLPLNMKNLGYHFFIDEPETQPLCYNCDSDRWLPTTELGTCCKEQENNKDKYKFLKGPDYAFKGDIEKRYNAFRKKNCYMKPVYKDIWNNKTVDYKVECDYNGNKVLDVENTFV
jgi:hypothetical protein